MVSSDELIDRGKKGIFVNIIIKTLKIIRKRPTLILLWGAIFLVTGLINQMNPIFSLVFHFDISRQGNVFNTLLTTLRLAMEFLSDTGYMSLVILVFTGLLIVVSLLLALVFSGGFNVMNLEITGRRSSGGFREGVRKYFLKYSVVNFTVLLLGTVFVLFMAIVTIPALVISSSWVNGKPELMTTALFVDFITLLTVFFGFMFFRTFLLFWYPALVNVPERAFTIGKRVADSNFWPIVAGFALFDIVFIVFEFAFSVFSFMAASYESPAIILSVVIFILRWAFETLFFLVFGVFVFDRFIRYYRKAEA